MNGDPHQSNPYRETQFVTSEPAVFIDEIDIRTTALNAAIRLFSRERIISAKDKDLITTVAAEFEHYIKNGKPDEERK